MTCDLKCRFDTNLNEAMKELPAGRTAKSRACVRGDKDPSKMYLRTDSPTVDRSTISILLSISTLFSVVLSTIDVNRAFLYPDLRRGKIFVSPPEEFGFRGSSCVCSKLWAMRCAKSVL